jgi:cytochrome P450
MATMPMSASDTNLDHHSAEFRENNYDILRELQGRCPVAKSSAWAGFWLFTSYDTVFEASRDPELFSSHMSKGVPTVEGQTDPLIPIDIDPPMLQEYRKILLPHMSPGAARAKTGDLRTMATELIDVFIETGQADLSTQLFTPLPARWILQLLGFDDSQWGQWIEWIHTVIHDRASEPEKTMQAVMELYGAMSAEIARRREQPTEDLTTVLIRAEIDSRPLTDPELIGIVFLLLLGGMDTTAGLTGNAFLRIDADPALRRRLDEDPGVLDRSTEEFLRHDTPTQGLARIVTRDAEFHGRQLRKGDRVLLMYAAANRDPGVFDRPGVIDFDRAENRHLAFGLGLHRCLGSNFARVMFRVMITETLRRMPDIRVSGQVERYPDAGDVYAVRNLPVRFTPGSREAS